jgi:hypothetical protein
VLVGRHVAAVVGRGSGESAIARRRGRAAAEIDRGGVARDDRTLEARVDGGRRNAADPTDPQLAAALDASQPPALSISGQPPTLRGVTLARNVARAGTVPASSVPLPLPAAAAIAVRTVQSVVVHPDAPAVPPSSSP